MSIAGGSLVMLSHFRNWVTNPGHARRRSRRIHRRVSISGLRTYGTSNGIHGDDLCQFGCCRCIHVANARSEERIHRQNERRERDRRTGENEESAEYRPGKIEEPVGGWRLEFMAALSLYRPCRVSFSCEEGRISR